MSGLNTLISEQSQVLQADINSSHVALEGVSTRLSALLRNFTLTELPVGSIVSLASAYVPPGFLLCNGSSVSKAAYPLLFSAIRDTYGASPPAGSFFLPDLRGRVAAGLDAMGSSTAAGRIRNITSVLGAVGGNEAESLTMLHIPAHNHSSGSLNIRNSGSHKHTDTGHTHSYLVPTSATGGPIQGIPIGSPTDRDGIPMTTGSGTANLSPSTHSHPSGDFLGTTAPSGQSAPAPFSKLQPTMLLNFIIKATSLA
jgi:microcystin-dependent protein